MTLHTVFLVVAAVLAFVGAFPGVSSRVNLTSAALGFLALALLVH